VFGVHLARLGEASKIHSELKTFLLISILVVQTTITPGQTIKFISKTICDSISQLKYTGDSEMLSKQRSIYKDEMIKYPTLIVDITDLNKPHQYNEFSYKINRELLKTCPKYRDQFSLLPLSKILDVEGLFYKDKYDSLERSIIEFIHLKKIDLLIMSIDDLYPYTDIAAFGKGQSEKWKTGKRYERGGIFIVFSKELNRMNISLNLKTSSIISSEECDRIIEDIALPYFEEGNYYLGIMKSIQALKDKV